MTYSLPTWYNMRALFLLSFSCLSRALPLYSLINFQPLCQLHLLTSAVSVTSLQPLLFAYSILFIFVFLAFCLFIGNDPKHPRSDFYSSSSVRSPVDCSNYLKRTSNICKPPLVIKLSHSLYMRICVRRCHLYLFFKFLALFY